MMSSLPSSQREEQGNSQQSTSTTTKPPQQQRRRDDNNSNNNKNYNNNVFADTSLRRPSSSARHRGTYAAPTNATTSPATSTSTTALPPIDTATLLQSAARSVLDGNNRNNGSSSNNKTSSSAAAMARLGGGGGRSRRSSAVVITSSGDDGSETGGGGGGGSPQQVKMMNDFGFNHHDDPIPTYSLQSLETKKMPALPDEQDRRRFLVRVNGDPFFAGSEFLNFSPPGNCIAFEGCLAAVLASLYDYDALDENDDVLEASRAESRAFNEVDDDDDDGALDDPNNTASTSVTEIDDYEDCEDEDDDQIMLMMETPTMSASFEYSDAGETVYTSGTAASGISSAATQRSSSMPYSHKPPPQQRRSSPRHMTMTTIDSNRTRVSRSRHRKRRYDVYCQFLLNSADYLMLEKSQARAFVPLLSRLLVPAAYSPKNKKREPPLRATSDVSSSSTTSKQKPPLWKATRPSSSMPYIATDASDASYHTPSPSHSAATSTNTASTFAGGSSALESKRLLEKISGAPIDGFAAADGDIVEQEVQEIEHLQAFLESMSPGGGFRCLSLVLLRHLLISQDGYDARVRRALKTLGVILLVKDMDVMDFHGTTSKGRRDLPDLIAVAALRFESLEHEIASKLIRLSQEEQVRQRGGKPSATKTRRSKSAVVDRGKGQGFSREQIVRGLKVGAVGVAAASLFAVTGGLAAPGIAAGVAAFAGGTAATAAVAAMLTSTAAVTAIFGVGGGTLVAYKMNRRVKGLTEFEFRKETGQNNESTASTGNSRKKQPEPVEAELFSTICISGWLNDSCDFQRPWGVLPSNPWIADRLELLERFYAVYRPDHVPKCKKILKSWEGEEHELWRLLRQKYGRDPDCLFPLEEGPRLQGSLTLEQKETVDLLFVELGYAAPRPESTAAQQATPFERMRVGWNNRGNRKAEKEATCASQQNSRLGSEGFDSLHGPRPLVAEESSVTSSGFESISTTISAHPANPEEPTEETQDMPKHIGTVWDYQKNYGGELYTVRWESELLTELCDSVADLAFDVVTGATTQILKQTALSTLLSAIAWPYALVNAANMIDGTWTLAVERSDEAGRELARSLLFSKAGHRPVTLVGFSFGARIIYSCLKELAKYQEKWTEYRERPDGSLANDLSPSPVGGSAEEGTGNFYRNMREPASIVEDAILLGLPNHLSLSSWKACRQVVSGRLVNCFSQKDLILSLMFQFKRLRLNPVCGTCPVTVRGVENIDVSDLVPGHIDYCTVVGDVLKRVRFQQPFRSRHKRTFRPDLPIEVEEGSKLADKFDV